MKLIGVNRSPYTRRVAITLAALAVPYEQRCVSGFGNRDEVRTVAGAEGADEEGHCVGGRFSGASHAVRDLLIGSAVSHEQEDG